MTQKGSLKVIYVIIGSVVVLAVVGFIVMMLTQKESLVPTAITPAADQARATVAEDSIKWSSASLGIEFYYPNTLVPDLNGDYIAGEPMFYRDVVDANRGRIALRFTGRQDDSRTIDEIIEDEIQHKLQPFGASPEIRTLNVDGQPARMIVPRAEDLARFGDNARQDRGPMLIVALKKPLFITPDENTDVAPGDVKFLIVDVKGENGNQIIEQIARTLRLY